MSRVLVVDSNRHPVHPCTPARARLLLKQGKAAVFKRYPFTLILKAPVTVATELAAPPGLRLKIDPGSQTTGLALVDEQRGAVVWAAELSHQGDGIVDRLRKRKAVRRSRRQRHTRYRKARFAHRSRPKGWLAPSLRSRVQNVVTWVQRLQRVAPIVAISLELVHFDTQAMQNPDIEGVLYQQGTLAGYEAKQYLLEKWGWRCAYCDARGVPVEVEHIVARSRGGSSRESNLTSACQPCNGAKGTQDIGVFLAHDPARLAHILGQAKAPLKDAAAVNSTRWALYEQLKALGLPLEVGSGGRTKWNRSRQAIPKAHWSDAACVGVSTPELKRWQRMQPLLITAKGRQRRQMVNVDKRGFPRGKPKGPSRVHGFRSGDMVRAIVPTGLKAGTYVGRVAIRTTGSFKITTKRGMVDGIAARFCTPLHRGDGYDYAYGSRVGASPQA